MGLFALLANTGIRPAEALALTRADLHLEQRPAWIKLYRMKKKKATREFDEIDLPDEVAAALARHLSSVDGEAVFPMHRREVQRAFHVYRRLARIGRHHVPYGLRHTVATRIYVLTRNIDVVQRALGHEHPDMSAIYAHVPPAVLVETVQAIPPNI